MAPLTKMRRETVAMLAFSVLTVFVTRATSQQACVQYPAGTWDCSGKRLLAIPKGLPAQSVRILKVNENAIKRIKAEDFEGLTHLEELILHHNEIEEIDSQSLCNITKLKTLSLSYNKLSALPDLRLCKSLVDLSVDNNLIASLDGSQLNELAQLERLDLTKNRLTELSRASLPSGTSLKTLLLNRNNIAQIALNAFVNVTSLERLRLSRNLLSQLTGVLFKPLEQLLVLDLSRNQLSTIEYQHFTGLTKVREITLERNKITSLQDGAFYECQALTTLNLEGNQLRELRPGPFYGLQNLKGLNVKNNNISSIADNTWSLTTSLEELVISNNTLETISRPYFLKLGNLRVLLVAKNKIKQIEAGAFNDLKHLVFLDLGSNELSDSLQSTPDSVFQSLKNVSNLDLRGNRIQTISSKLLSGLDSVHSLNLRDNPVTTIESYAFSALPSLKRLEMSTEQLICDCKVSWFAAWLKQFGYESTVSARCILPTRLLGMAILSIKLENFTCNEGELSHKPKITRQLRPTNAWRWSNMTLTCIATTNSASNLSVEWRKYIKGAKDTVKVMLNATNQIQTEATTADGRSSMYTTYLHLYNVSERDEGDYQCGFINQYGNDYSDVVKLTVQEFPTFVSTPSNVTVKMHQDAKLLCEATGYPPPQIVWKKDGEDNSFPAAREGRISFNPDLRSELIIMNVQYQDRGLYTCEAYNTAGTIITNATVDVRVPPMFIEKITCKNTKAGAYLLKCQAEGNPKPPIVWLKDGKVIQASERYIFSVTYNNLFIVDGTKEDSGIYTCTASNTLGKVSQSCDIRIEEILTETADAAATSKKSPALSQNTITGLIVIAVVCCVVGTSLVWVVIIYKTRRRRGDNCSANTDETNVPLNTHAISNAHSQKIGTHTDSLSSSSQPSKSDSFLEYDGSHDSSVFTRSRAKIPGDMYLADGGNDHAALEPLAPSSHGSSSECYSTASAMCYAADNMPASISSYQMAERAHPFSTFQPSRHYRCVQNGIARGRSAEYIPYIDKSQPPDIAHLLCQLKAPSNQPPDHLSCEVKVVPTHAQQNAQSLEASLYEEPAYANLPTSAVTPTGQKPKHPAKVASEYMNVSVDPESSHIYQNSNIMESCHTTLEKGGQRGGSLSNQRESISSLNTRDSNESPNHSSTHCSSSRREALADAVLIANNPPKETGSEVSGDQSYAQNTFQSGLSAQSHNSHRTKSGT